MRESHVENTHVYNNKKQNQSNQSNQSNQLENNYKTNVSFYMRKSIADLGRSYARRAGMSVGDFVEQSFILFMDVNPIRELFYAIEQPVYASNDLEDTMAEIIAIGDLEEWLEEIKPLIDQGITIHKSRIKTLQGIIKECKKINKRSSKLDKLLEEATTHVKQSYL